MKTVNQLKKRNIPIINTLNEFEKDMKRYPLSYWKSTDTVTLGRRITKGLLLRWLLTFTLLTMILVVSIIIGLATMSITLKVSQIIIIYCVIFIGLWILIINNLLPSGSSIVTSRFNCIEFTEKGVTYYESTSFIKNLKYLVSILKGNDEVTIEDPDGNRLLIINIQKTMKMTQYIIII